MSNTIKLCPMICCCHQDVVLVRLPPIISTRPTLDSCCVVLSNLRYTLTNYRAHILGANFISSMFQRVHMQIGHLLLPWFILSLFKINQSDSTKQNDFIYSLPSFWRYNHNTFVRKIKISTKHAQQVHRWLIQKVSKLMYLRNSSVNTIFRTIQMPRIYHNATIPLIKIFLNSMELEWTTVSWRDAQ